MSIAFIPSPSQGVWHLGPVPIRAYALCIIAGVIVAVWVAERRYRAIGGRPGLILDVATWAVPFGLVGARLYHVITDYELYFGAGRDPWNVFKIWDGGIGIPGAIALGAVGAWIACRRAGVKLGPVAGAAAPGIALAQAIGRWGNWFNQELYGRPSTLPWALEISPQHRAAGFENVTTYQPTFLYESLWDVGVALLVIWAAHRFLLTGDRTFALYLAAYGVGRFITESLRIDYAHHVLGLRVNQWMAIIIFVGGVLYLYRTRDKIGPDVIEPPASAPVEASQPGGATASLPTADDNPARITPTPDEDAGGRQPADDGGGEAVADEDTTAKTEQASR
ncbi:MAG TPA: prolipoprotein diacylglyceryl transferase [Streptosporangiaceae bacterium]|nr:prolipoprotein diacylglyceryl transferase [Streptosporangiaceae bacterium]